MMDNVTSHSSNSPSIAFTLLSYYSSEPEPYPQPWTKGRLLDRWHRTYPEQWICWALIESLYQGRYKTYCVEKILALWLRRGEPVYHFNHEFENMICNNVPQRIEAAAVTNPVTNTVTDTVTNTSVSSRTERSGEPIGNDEWDGVDSQVPYFAQEHAEGLTVSDAIEHETDPLCSQLVEPLALNSQGVDSSMDENQQGDEAQDMDWVDAFEQPATRQRDFDLSGVLSRHQLLPFTLGRMGLEPIHRFMPEAEPVEFCEKLAAIARSHP